MMTTLNFDFSADEINHRSMLLGEPPQLVLFKRHGVPVEGKIPYTLLMCQKIKDLVPSHAEYSVSETFKEVAHEMCRSYVICSHRIKSPVSYTKAELKLDSPLTFSIIVRCTKCLDREPQPVAFVEAPQHVPQQVAEDVEKLIMPEDNSLTPVFRAVSAAVNSSMARHYHECSATNRPLLEYAGSQERQRDSIIAAFDEAFGEAFRARIRTPPPSPPHGEPAVDPLRLTNQNLRCINDVLGAKNPKKARKE